MPRSRLLLQLQKHKRLSLWMLVMAPLVIMHLCMIRFLRMQERECALGVEENGWARRVYCMHRDVALPDCAHAPS